MKSGSMRALELRAPGDFSIIDTSIPTVRSMEVLARVETVLICGTDPHIIAGHFPGFWPQQYPFIPGHEWAGVIEQVSDEASELGWHPGDRVCGISHVGCGYCRMCMTGRFNLCLNYGREAMGHRQYGHYTQGAYAQYMRTHIRAIARIPDSMGFNVAAMMDPLSIALHVVNRANLEPGDDLLVNGTGPQGLLSIMLARHMGAGRIFASGSGHRLRVAQDLGAIPIDYRTENVVERVKALTDGHGAKRVVECAGTPDGIRTACDAVARGGRVSMVGIPNDDVLLPIRRIVLDEIELVGDRANPNTLEPALGLATENEFDLAPLVTHEFPLEDFATALDVFVERRDNSLKVAIKPLAAVEEDLNGVHL